MYLRFFIYKETKTKLGSVCRADQAQSNGPTLRSLANFHIDLEQFCCSLTPSSDLDMSVQRTELRPLLHGPRAVLAANLNVLELLPVALHRLGGHGTDLRRLNVEVLAEGLVVHCGVVDLRGIPATHTHTQGQ